MEKHWYDITVSAFTIQLYTLNENRWDDRPYLAFQSTVQTL